MSACVGPEPWHGTRVGYQSHGCRGDACREANSAYRRRDRIAPSWAGQGSYTINPLLVPDTMTRQELLAARGYPA